MSGPKDFVVVFAVERLLEMQFRRAAVERNRAAALLARQEAARERASERAAHRAAKAAEKARAAKLRAEQEMARLVVEQQHAAQAEANRKSTSEQLRVAAAEHARQTAARSAARRKRAALAQRQSHPSPAEPDDFDEPTASDEPDPSATQDAQPGQPVAQSTGGESPAAPDDGNNERLNRQQQELEAQLEAWQEELAADEAVKQFQTEAATAWQAGAQVLSAKFSLAPTAAEMADLAERCQASCAEAARIHKEAGLRQGKFASRNELLADIMASLQEIGFFVSDPEYQDPRDPGGAVIIKATRGGEEIRAEVDLTDTVRSVWNGVSAEGCPDAFFDYLDRMKRKGVEIHATRADLQSRPVLKHAGAKDLPRSDARRQGS